MASEVNRSAYAGPDTMTRIIITMPTGRLRVDFQRSEDNRPVEAADIKIKV
jgi:hypothetical protein